MKLSKFCSEDLITFELKSTDKDSVLHELVELAAKSNLVKDAGELVKDEDILKLIGDEVAHEESVLDLDIKKGMDEISRELKKNTS